MFGTKETHIKCTWNCTRFEFPKIRRIYKRKHFKIISVFLRHPVVTKNKETLLVTFTIHCVKPVLLKEPLMRLLNQYLDVCNKYIIITAGKT